MSSSENESDFASAESDREDEEMINQQSDNNQESSTVNDTQPQSSEEPSTSETTDNPPDTTQDTTPSTTKDTSPVESKPGSSSHETKPSVEETPSVEVPKPSMEETKPSVEETKPSVEVSKPSVEPEETEPSVEETKPSVEASVEETKPSMEDPDPKQSTGGWGWSGWGNSLWSSVSTVTESAQVLSNKVSSVIASVEEGLGLPSPADMAKSDAEEEKELAKAAVETMKMKPVLEEPHSVPESNPEKQSEASVSDDTYGVGFLSGLASVVQSTGKGLMSGGLDALETLGKKTMEALSEGDPGLQVKRSMLGGKSAPTLSQLLEEAKNKPAESSLAEGGGEREETPLCYSRLFDEYHGVVHLEALELLSRECSAKVMGPSATDEDMERLRERMEELEALFQVEEEQDALDDDSSKLAEVLELFSTANFPLKVDKLLKVSNAWRDKVEQTSQEATPTPHEATPTSQEAAPASQEATPTTGESENQLQTKPKDFKPVCQSLYANGLRSLAELTSTAIELFRKISELSLLPDGNKRDPITQAKKLNRLTVLVSSELDCLASVHSEAIAQLGVPDTNSSVTSLYLEASNSSTYVQDAFQLLLPVLKLVQIQQLSSEVPQPNILPRT